MKPSIKKQGTATTLKPSKETLIKKLKACEVPIDYSDPNKDIKEKSERIRAIKHLQAMIDDEKTMQHVIVPNLDKVMEMIEKNIFRPLPNISSLEADENDGIGQEDMSDPAWPYLMGIYEIFHMCVTSNLVEANVLKAYIKAKFVEEFL